MSYDKEEKEEYDKDDDEGFKYDNEDEFDLNKYLIEEEEPENELLDYTSEFLELLKKLAGKDGFGAIIWIIGTTGSGKSALMCELDDLLLKNSYPKRNVAFYQAPEKLLKEVQKAVPSTLRSKFRNIDKLSEVKKFDILNIDEGYLSADAKNALLKDSVNFIESLTTLRHNSVIVILNSLDNGILRGYRTKAQIKLYKLLPEGYLDETNDKFAKKHREYIKHLLQEQTIFSISHIDFLKADIQNGALVLPLKKYCNWYNEKISRSFEGEDFDARMRRLVKKKENMEGVIELLIQKFGRNLTVKLARGFLFYDYIETFREFEQDINNIVDVANYKMYEDQRIQEEEIRKEITEQLSVDSQIYDSFSDFVCTDDQIFDLIRKSVNWRNIERDISIFRESQEGKKQQELADKYGVKFNTISMVITKVQGAVNRWKGKLFEDFVKKRLKESGLFEKVEKLAGKGECDILAYLKDGKKLIIYSLKNLKIDRDSYCLVKEELNPELARAKLQAKDYEVQLILVVFNNHTNQIKRFKIDYKNPINIIIPK